MAAFPLEIIESIIDFLAASYSSTSSIKACCLVSRSLLPRARTHLFGSIKINGNSWEPPKPTPLMFSRLLTHTPEIAYYVTSLNYNVTEKDLAAVGFAQALSTLTSLKHLTLQSSIMWKHLPFREVILNLMYLPTLRYLRLRVKGFYLSDLALCTGLKSLEGSSFAAERGKDVEMDQEPSYLEHFVERSNDLSFLQLCTTYRTDGKPVVDVSRLKTLTLQVPNVELDRVTPWFRTCTQLTYVNLHGCETLLMQGSLANLFLSSIRTLKHICMSFDVLDDDSEDLFLSLFSGFKCLADGNVIESIEIVLYWNAGTHGDEWGALEVFNPSKSSWKALRKLSLHINVFLEQHYYDVQEVVENLEQLPHTQLRTLARSDTFDFKVIL